MRKIGRIRTFLRLALVFNRAPAFRTNIMAIVGNKLYRNIASKKEDSVLIDQQLSKLEEDIRRLKIDFDIYFNGSAKRPPLEAKARIEANMKRIGDNRNLAYAQRYYFNTLMSRLTSYRELWRRMLKKRGEEADG